MNIFHKITLTNLKKNKTRTIVTIIGIILSTAMFTAVTSSISSLHALIPKEAGRVPLFVSPNQSQKIFSPMMKSSLLFL